MNKTFAALFAALAIAFASTAVAVDAPAAPIKLPAKPGAVTFNHTKHVANGCKTCHADDKGGPIDGFNKTVAKEKAHAKCHDCHKKEKKGPQKCAECHKK